MDRTLEFLDALHEDVDVEMTESERDFIRSFTARHCRPAAETVARRLEAFAAERLRRLFAAAPRDLAMAASPPGAKSTAEPVSPDEEVTFVFISDLNAAEDEAWRAELKVPPSATAESPVDIKVTDSSGRNVTDGVLRVSGVSVPLGENGAKLPFSLFLAGIKDTDVRLSRAGGPSVRGRLAFF